MKSPRTELPDADEPGLLGPRPRELSEDAEDLLREVAERRLFGDAPLRIGRYRISGVLGRGGMGTVLEAHDEELDRRVAVKVVHCRPGVADHESTQRVQREARALAATSHPNIVEVFEVGADDRGVFIAMEMVDGEPLDAWLQTPRTWREVLDVGVQAGRGLAAAHRQGLIHGDFKPSNVVVGSDGRVRVVDFGLARAASELTADAPVGGTVAYMAPEQFDGVEGGPLADQYSFCVALYEALWGTRPDRWVLRRGAVPRALERVVLRGLEREPGRRFVSMDALLERLDRRRFRPGAAVLGAGAVGAIATAFTIGSGHWSSSPDAACPSSQSRAQALLRQADRDAMREAFTATGRAHAPTTLAAVEVALDEHVGRWADAEAALCEAQLERHAQGRPADRVAGCLADRRRRVWAVIETLRRADAQTVDHAVDLVATLRPVEACWRSLGGAGPVAVPLTLREPIDDLRARLALAEAMGRTGRVDAAVERIGRLLEEAETIGVASVVAQVRASYGRALSQAGQQPRAKAELEAAFMEATAADDDETVALTSVALLGAHAAYDGDVEVARRWQRRASAALERIDGPLPLRCAYLRFSASLAETRGAYREALELAQQAVELAESDPGVQLDLALGVLAQMMYRASRHDEAAAVLARTVRAQRQVYGDRHPRLGQTLLLSAAVALARDRAEEGVALGTDAVAILKDTFGPEALATLNAEAQLGVHLAQAGDPARARAALEATLVAVGASLGPEHPLAAQLLTSLGRVSRGQGELTDAREYLVRAVQRLELAHGSDHPLLATGLSHLGDVHRKLGEFDSARTAHGEALRIRRHHGAPARVAASLEAMARLSEDEGKLRDATSLYDQASRRWAEALGDDDPNAVETRRLAREIRARIR